MFISLNSTVAGVMRHFSSMNWRQKDDGGGDFGALFCKVIVDCFAFARNDNNALLRNIHCAGSRIQVRDDGKCVRGEK